MEFTKMHGLGNDFILIDSRAVDEKYDQLAVELCNRHSGIGADGILIILPTADGNADVQMCIINSDGTEADMCGNGIRCFARYLYEHNIIKKPAMKIATNAGIIKIKLVFNRKNIESIMVDMGKVGLNKKDIPFLGKTENIINEKLESDGKVYNITSVLVGVPHTMVFVDDVNKVDIKKIGPAIEHHKMFPMGTNVDFVEVMNKNEIKVRTWERGAGATLACGTGCCAAVVASYLNKFTADEVIVHLKLGQLKIKYADNHVYMTGPAVEVFSGNYKKQ